MDYAFKCMEEAFNWGSMSYPLLTKVSLFGFILLCFNFLGIYVSNVIFDTFCITAKNSLIEKEYELKQLREDHQEIINNFIMVDYDGIYRD